MRIRLEDTWTDVLGKAARGLGLGPDAIASRAAVDRQRVEQLLRGEFDAEVAARVAAVLELDARALGDLAEGMWQPQPVAVAGLAAFTTPCPVPGYAEMTVNAYLAWDAASGTAVAFDTGADAGPMLQALRSHGLRLEMVLLTHAHHDHVQALAPLLKAAGNPPVWVNQNEPLSGARTFVAGRSFKAGGLSISSRLTAGHSPGGTTYHIAGLERPVAVVGDALFCGSQGGVGQAQYRAATQAIREHILSLPDESVVCPGHGPVTTVGEELRNNPFHAGSRQARSGARSVQMG